MSFIILSDVVPIIYIFIENEADSRVLEIANTCGLYYKHMMIINDDSSIESEQSF